MEDKELLKCLQIIQQRDNKIAALEVEVKWHREAMEDKDNRLEEMQSIIEEFITVYQKNFQAERFNGKYQKKDTSAIFQAKCIGSACEKVGLTDCPEASRKACKRPDFIIDLGKAKELGVEAYAREIVVTIPVGREEHKEGRCVCCVKHHNYWCGQSPFDYCITNITEWLKQELAKPLE